MRVIQRPVILDAFRVTVENIENTPAWPGWLATVFGQHVWQSATLSSGIPWSVRTAHGISVVSLGDWILRAATGALSVCKSGEFEKLYAVLPSGISSEVANKERDVIAFIGATCIPGEDGTPLFDGRGALVEVNKGIVVGWADIGFVGSADLSKEIVRLAEEWRRNGVQ